MRDIMRVTEWPRQVASPESRIVEAKRLKRPMERRIFPEGKDAKARPYDDFHWSRFKHFAPADMYVVVGEHLFVRRRRFWRISGSWRKRYSGG